MTATRTSRDLPISTTALMKCVVPMVTLATSCASTLDCSNISRVTLKMPSLGFFVVLDFFQATMPLSGSDDLSGFNITPSVFVLFSG